MLDRCANPGNKRYADYGGRGIRVCERWQDVSAFIADMETSFMPGLELDRVNVDGDYEPTNCQWATHAEQARNKRNLIYIDHLGRRMTLAEWCAELGVNYGTAWERIKVLGWQPLNAITTPTLNPSAVCERARAARKRSSR